MTRPIVIAHRGASGYRPEHTLEAYALAIAQGADFIEPDLVPTADGVLIARHDNELSASTDVATRPEFADRRCRKRIDGVDEEGWFSEDFSWAEIQRLRARERVPELRPDNARHDGRLAIPCLADIVALLRTAEAGGRVVGMYPEIKHPTWFAHEGRRLDGGAIAQEPGALLVAQLQALRFTDPARLFVQSFEPASLRHLRDVLLPAAGLAWPLVQLLGPLDRASPYDLCWHRQQGDDLAAIYGDLPAALAGAATPRYRDLVDADGLAWLRRHADALGPHKDDLLAAGDAGPPWFAAARAHGFVVHPYTLRAEYDGATQARALLAMGVDGMFFDQPDLGVAVRDEFVAASARRI